MHDSNTADGEFLVQSGGDFLHFRQRHGLIRFVFEIQSAAAARVVPHAAVESHHGSVARSPDISHHLADGNGLPDQLNQINFGAGAHMSHRLQPPLTGGRNAISSPACRRVVQGANSRFREATSEERNSATAGCREATALNKSSIGEPTGSSTVSSDFPAISRKRPKKRTLTRMVASGDMDWLYSTANWRRGMLQRGAGNRSARRWLHTPGTG